MCFRVYNFLSTGKSASDVAGFLDVMQRNGQGKSSSLLNMTSRSLRSTLLQNGMTEALVDELATVAVRVNYGQGPDFQNLLKKRRGRISLAYSLFCLPKHVLKSRSE